MGYTCRYQRGIRINRNIVECKFFFEIQITQQRHVLIETLWNVNKEGDVLWVDAVPY